MFESQAKKSAKIYHLFLFFDAEMYNKNNVGMNNGLKIKITALASNNSATASKNAVAKKILVRRNCTLFVV